MAAWTAGPIAAVEEWLRLHPGSAVPGAWTRRGEAATAAEDGWLQLDLRDRPGLADLLDPPLCLAGREGPEGSTAHPVEQYRLVDGVLLLRLPAGTPPAARWVWTPSASPRAPLEHLLAGLRAAGPAPLAEALAAGRLDGAPSGLPDRAESDQDPPATASADDRPPPPDEAATDPMATGDAADDSAATEPVETEPIPPDRPPLDETVPDPAGTEPAVTEPGGPADLTAEQAAAHRACLSPGLRVVWAPAATGRTRVLARVAADLVRAGRRVLLVSTADAVLDAVLLAVFRATAAEPGTLLRVGPPALAGVADGLRLDALAAAASAEVDERRALIARRLTDLAGADVEITALAARLDGYDPEGYRAAAARVAAAGRREELRTRYQDTLGAAELAYGRVVTARRELDRLVADAASQEAARAGLARLPELQRELRELDAQDEQLRGGAAGGRSRRRSRQADAERRAFTSSAVARRRELWDEIIATRRAIGATTAAQLDRLDDARARAERAATAAWLAFEPVEGELRRLERAMEQATEVGPTSDADRALVERSDRERLPALHERWTRLRAIRAQNAGDRAAHEDEHRRFAERSRTLRREAEAELVGRAGLVVSSLVRSRSHPALAAASFDVVLVDGAEAAALAEVLLVLCRATEGAVLLGDVLGPGPELPDAVAASTDPAVRTWVRASCFAHVGITTPDDALAHEGCVVLRHPLRGGAGLRRLVNDLGHRVLRDPHEAGIDTDPDTHPDTEVVVVDVSTLPGLAALRHGPSGQRWRLAGPVLGPALARISGAPTGVLTSTRAQAGLTLAALRDGDLVAGFGCATVAASRGAGYDTVVLDTVLPGTADEPDPREFAAALTRARRRVYVLADGPAPGADGPWAELGQAVRRGDARSWSAASLLGLDGPAPYRSDRALAELGDPLREAVGAVEVSGTAALRAELDRHLGAARDSLWMWSPWLDTGAEVVVALVGAAVARGVRVRVFVRPGADPGGDAAADALRGVGATVVHADRGPEQVVVVDRGTVLLGSTVRPGDGRACLLAVPGRALAERLLAELDAEALGGPRACAGCADPMDVRGEGDEVRWECRSCGAGAELGAGRPS